MPGDERDYREWIRYAEVDLFVARSLNFPGSASVVAFHSQQAAEKFFKAFLIFKGQSPKKIHDLLLLESECRVLDQSLPKLASECMLLTPFATSARYPGLAEPTDTEVRAIVSAAERIRTEILKLIP
jgi:HEPN domain-containing protein